MPNFSLKGRNAIVTGGAGGMGGGFSKALAEHGANVAVFDLNSPLQELVDAGKEYDVKIEGYTVDVSSLDSLKQAYEQFEKDFGTLDIFVGSAGINKVIDFLETDWDFHLQIVLVNQLGLYHSAQLAAKLMIKCRTKCGSIIMVGSSAGQIAVRSVNTSAYNSTKGGVLAMVPSIAKETGPHGVILTIDWGIRCNSLSPGYTKTLMTKDYHELLEIWAKESMLGRVAEMEDMAGACIFLASDASRNVTGHDLVVDGGATKW